MKLCSIDVDDRLGKMKVYAMENILLFLGFLLFGWVAAFLTGIINTKIRMHIGFRPPDFFTLIIIWFLLVSIFLF
jgi:hypothetical protein